MVGSTTPPRVRSGAKTPMWNVGREKGMSGISETDFGLREAGVEQEKFSDTYSQVEKRVKFGKIL